VPGFVMRGYECQHCGKVVLPQRLQRTGRPRLFCSDRCRKRAFRLARLDGGYGTSGASENLENKLAAGRNPGNSPAVTVRVPAEVRDIEQPWRNAGEPIVSSHGVTCFVVGKLRRSRC
jgi:hypothetical protein